MTGAPWWSCTWGLTCGCFTAIWFTVALTCRGVGDWIGIWALRVIGGVRGAKAPACTGWAGEGVHVLRVG